MPNPKPYPTSPEEAKEWFWKHGRLDYLLHPSQDRAWQWVEGWKKEHRNSALPLVLNNHRAWGKTFWLAAFGLGRGFSRPGQEIRFGSETISQANKIVEPNIEKILDEMPPGYMAQKKSDMGAPYYELFNPHWPLGARPSRFWIIGCRERADIQRGLRSHVILLDECRNIDNFEYVARDVFGPHFATMEDPVYIMVSTPPESMDHAWNSIYVEDAIREGRYFECPVTSNENWSKEDNERMLEQFRSDPTSVAWRREMGCERISDPTRLVVPEFDEEKHTHEEYERPRFLTPLRVADGGYVDYFATLFGYVDWEKHKLIVEDEIVEKKKHIGEMSDLIKRKEEVLYGIPAIGADGKPTFTFPTKVRGYADMKPIELATFASVYKLYFEPPPDRHDPDETISHLRDQVFKGHISISKKCKMLIYQLRNAIRDEKGKLTRSENAGHWDAVMALAYMAKAAPWRVNPGFDTRQKFDWTTQQIRRGAFTEKTISGSRKNLRGILKRRFNG